MTTRHSDLAHTLTQSLHLTLAPVAMHFTDEPPAGIPAFDKSVAAGCRFWQEAATSLFVTSPADHDRCAIGTYTHNLPGSAAHEKDRGDALKVFADLGYLPAAELARVPVLAARRNHIVYGPLASMPLRADVVLLLVKASQSLILSEAAAGVDGGTPPAMGRPACAIVPQAINTQMAALSLGCCGARAYLDVLTDDVALFALPGDKLEAYVARIAELAKANTILASFHQLRRRDVEAGRSPTILESLARLQSGTA